MPGARLPNTYPQWVSQLIASDHHLLHTEKATSSVTSNKRFCDLIGRKIIIIIKIITGCSGYQQSSILFNIFGKLSLKFALFLTSISVSSILVLILTFSGNIFYYSFLYVNSKNNL